MSAIRVEHLHKRYGPFAALTDVGFEVAAGQVAALLGPNGAGKTTTMEILEGYQPASDGVVEVLGVAPRHAGRAWRARIGLVLQSTSLDAHLTVGEALGVYAGLYPRPRPVPEVLELIDLTGDASTRIGQLSGGQRRRVDVGLGIIGRPELLFLDEPTTGLDPVARRQAWTTVERLCADGTTVLLTTHYLEEAQQLADRVLVLSRGRLVADARPDDLRGRGRLTRVRYPLPPAAPTADLPTALAAGADPDAGELVVHTAEVAETLGALLGWAGRHRIDLAGLEVGPPSLEEAYLDLVGAPADTKEEVAAHA